MLTKRPFTLFRNAPEKAFREVEEMLGLVNRAFASRAAVGGASSLSVGVVGVRINAFLSQVPVATEETGVSFDASSQSLIVLDRGVYDFSFQVSATLNNTADYSVVARVNEVETYLASESPAASRYEFRANGLLGLLAGDRVSLFVSANVPAVFDVRKAFMSLRRVQ